MPYGTVNLRHGVPKGETPVTCVAAVATYIVNQLVNNNTAHPDYLDKINWYFLPSANPDGYSWSWDHDRY